MSEQLNIVMAQLNFLVGDIEGNTELIVTSAKRAADEFAADVVVFPELALTGYPPEDLLLRPSLKPRVEKALQRILQENFDPILVIGFPESNGDVVYNSLLVTQQGDIAAKYRKQCLPNYQVFDERRYFVAGDSPCTINLKNTKIYGKSSLPVRRKMQARRCSSISMRHLFTPRSLRKDRR